MSDRRLWTEQEDALITQLVNEYGCKSWTQIAAEMRLRRPSGCRTSKQIRERWYNHLSPDIRKEAWTLAEERVIFDAHRRYGSKWKQIAKELSSRTDNSVKNHFYSTLRRSLRRINKYLGNRNSTTQMRLLKPSVLSRLVEASDDFSRDLVDKILDFASMKPTKSSIEEAPEIAPQLRTLFERTLASLTQQNEEYSTRKHTNRFIKLEMAPEVKLESCEDSATRCSTLNSVTAPEEEYQNQTTKVGESPCFVEALPFFKLPDISWFEARQTNSVRMQYDPWYKEDQFSTHIALDFY